MAIAELASHRPPVVNFGNRTPRYNGLLLSHLARILTLPQAIFIVAKTDSTSSQVSNLAMYCRLSPFEFGSFVPIPYCPYPNRERIPKCLTRFFHNHLKSARTNMGPTPVSQVSFLEGHYPPSSRCHSVVGHQSPELYPSSRYRCVGQRQPVTVNNCRQQTH